jgi:teichuronic acid biosynthesis glycosyltransferase TuaH
MIMKNRKIVIIANQPWDIEIGSNCKDIAIEFAKSNSVLYVNAPLDLNNLLRNAALPWVKRRIDVIRNRKKSLEKIQSNMWMLQPDFIAASINWIPLNFIHDFLNKRNNKRLARSVREACKELGFSEFVIFNDCMMIKGFYLKELLNPQLHIYYLRDYLISQPFFKKHGARLEKSLIEKSEIVLANSIFLELYAKKFNPNSFFVGQGCEVNHFFFDPSVKIPEPLLPIPTPIIGYVGFLTIMRLDIKLIEFIALNNKSWSIVLIGPEDEGFKNSNLHKISNIHFIEKQKPEDLPKFVQFFDVCINPQAVNDLTIGNYPRKIDEYLAMGKPIVATRTLAMEYFQDYCHLATNEIEFADKIKIALEPDSEEKKIARVNFAMSHSWEISVETIYSVIKDHSNVK